MRAPQIKGEKVERPDCFLFPSFRSSPTVGTTSSLCPSSFLLSFFAPLSSRPGRGYSDPATSGEPGTRRAPPHAGCTGAGEGGPRDGASGTGVCQPLLYFHKQ